MITINWNKAIAEALPVRYRKWNRYQWLLLLISQVRALHASIAIWWYGINYYLKHNGQVIYLEKVLNDLFDDGLRRIYITDGDFANRTLLFWRYEGETAIEVYWRWKFGIYATNDKVQHNGRIWLCMMPTSDEPGTSMDWQDEGAIRMWLTNGGIDFYVMVPIGLIYDVERMKALVNKYKLADKTYLIKEI